LTTGLEQQPPKDSTNKTAVLTTKDLDFNTGILFLEKTAELPACKYPASRPTSLFEKA
jgi:hypothetical protein